jgi:hypothetical protein
MRSQTIVEVFDLRAEVRHTTILYANVRARWTELDNVRLSPSDDEATPIISKGFDRAHR